MKLHLGDLTVESNVSLEPHTEVTVAILKSAHPGITFVKSCNELLNSIVVTPPLIKAIGSLVVLVIFALSPLLFRTIADCITSSMNPELLTTTLVIFTVPFSINTSRIVISEPVQSVLF